MWQELKGEGRSVQFVAVSDSNASWFLTSPPTPALTMPLFRDPSAGRTAWQAFYAGASKHDAFVFDKDGQLILRWRAAERSVSNWRTDIGAAVRGLPP